MGSEPASQRQSLMRLVEICRGLGKVRDLDALLEQIVEAACELTGSQWCFILLYEQETDLLKFVAGPPVHKEILAHLRLPLEKSIAGWVYQNSKPALVRDGSKEKRIDREMEEALQFKIGNLLAVPLFFQGETIGAIEIVNKLQAHYSQDDQMVLETLASQAAVATLSTLLFSEIRRAYSELQELDRLKDDFISIASHELRTPLGLILGHATLLKELVDDPQQARSLEVIERNAYRLKTITDDLSHVNSLKTERSQLEQSTTSINVLVMKVVASLQATAEAKHINLKARLPQEDLLVFGDQDKISIILNNLLNNALQFTDSNGHVLVSAESLPGYVRVNVIDDGIGIPAKDLPFIFDRFFQSEAHLTRRHGGMGLGLSIAKAMVEMHNGEIWVESVEGKGSKFTFLLPANCSRSDKASLVFSPEP